MLMSTVKPLDESFDKHTYNSHASHPLQSWEWGQARQNMGLHIHRAGEYESDRLVHVFQMSIHPLANTPYKIGYLPRSTFPSEPVLAYLQDFASKNGFIFIKIEPYAEEDSAPPAKMRLTKSTHALFPPWTQILDIGQPEEDLLKNMKPKTRYNIRLAQKKGVQVREMSTDEGFEIFQKLYFETCERQKYFGHTKKYHETVWKSLNEGIAHILVAFYNGIPLAAYELFHFHDVFYYTYGGTSDMHRNLMAANLLMWESILLGKKLGAKKYDMWGSLPPGYDEKHPWAGFTRFKEGYGTSYAHLMDGRDLVVNAPLYTLYNGAYRVRELYLRLRKSV